MTWRSFEPLVDPVLLAHVAASEDLELLVEFLLQLALPLEREIGRTDDEHAIGQAAQLQLADKQPSHDGLAGAGVIGEQKADLGDFEQIVVDRLQLVRQRIDPTDRQAEIGVEFVGDAEGVGLQTQPYQVAVADVGMHGVLAAQSCNKLSLVSRYAAKSWVLSPTRPSSQLSTPTGLMVITRIGSLNSEPLSISPGLTGLCPASKSPPEKHQLVL